MILGGLTCENITALPCAVDLGFIRAAEGTPCLSTPFTQTCRLTPTPTRARCAVPRRQRWPTTSGRCSIARAAGPAATTARPGLGSITAARATTAGTAGWKPSPPPNLGSLPLARGDTHEHPQDCLWIR